MGYRHYGTIYRLINAQKRLSEADLALSLAMSHLSKEKPFKTDLSDSIMLLKETYEQLNEILKNTDLNNEERTEPDQGHSQKPSVDSD